MSSELDRLDRSLEKGNTRAFMHSYLQYETLQKEANQELPLIYYVRLVNRYSRQSIPVLSGLERGDFSSVINSLDLEGEVKETVEKPLDIVDDVATVTYHWRKSRISERVDRAITGLKYKVLGPERKFKRLESLASFYLGLALNIYADATNFTDMLAADVFHSRGEMYGKHVINHKWDIYAISNGFNKDGFYYPNGRFEITPERDEFTDPLFWALYRLNKFASESWGKVKDRVVIPRDRWISEVVCTDRNEIYQDWCQGKPAEVEDTVLSAKAILSNLGIKF